MKEYNYIKCSCGGTIGMYNRDIFNCERCSTEFKLYNLDYDICLTNDKTGWIFPMKRKDSIMKKTYKVVEQECENCGKHFHLRYCSDGNYEYIDESCECESGFHPVEDEQSISEWIDTLNNT